MIMILKLGLMFGIFYNGGGVFEGWEFIFCNSFVILVIVLMFLLVWEELYRGF